MPSDLRPVEGDIESQETLLRWFRHEVGLQFDAAEHELDIERMCDCTELSVLAEDAMCLIDRGDW